MSSTIDVEPANESPNSPGSQLDHNGPEVNYYTRDAQGTLISGGITGIVELLDDGTALKSPFPGPEMENHILEIAKEAEIYRRIGPHARLIQMLGHSSSREGLILEYMKNGELKGAIRSPNSSLALKMRWAYQVAEAVDLLHRNGIIHCDVKPRNCLLDDEFNVKIIDFSGSSVDGSKSFSGEGTRFYLPRHYKEAPTVATDVFALGSTLYEIFVGVAPYEELPSGEVERRYAQKEFPDLDDVPCGSVIKGCWLSEFESVEDVLVAIRDGNLEYSSEFQN